MGVVEPNSTSHADISRLVGGEDEYSSGPGRGRAAAESGCERGLIARAGVCRAWMGERG